jgi:ribonuclease BN (tRNA processing enzyme)
LYLLVDHSRSGYLQSQVKGESHENLSVPINVYGPVGLSAFLCAMLTASDTFLVVPVIVYELAPGPVHEDDMEITCLSSRAKLYKVTPTTASLRSASDSMVFSMS